MKKLIFALAIAAVGPVFAGIEMVALGLTVGILGVPMNADCEAMPIRIFGTENIVVGIDRGSVGCKAKNVYGTQIGIFGGGVEEDMCGLQLGALWTGHIAGVDLDHCRMHGIQLGTCFARTATANGFQLSAVYAESKTVNGMQFSAFGARSETVNGLQFGGFYAKSKELNGLSIASACQSDDVCGLQLGFVNLAKKIHGVQIGVYNSADEGACFQLGILNRVKWQSAEYLPLINIGF